MSSPRKKYEKAHQILGLNLDDDIDEKLLKRCYHREALRYHPDKNQSAEAHARFVEISEAYENARNYHGFSEECEEGTSEQKDDPVSTFVDYTKVLFSFLSPVLDAEVFQGIKPKWVCSIIENISNKCETKALELLGRLNRKQCGKICELLRAQQDVLHIPDSFIMEMAHMYSDKFGRDECIRIYPSLNDVYADNVYKLECYDKTYYIPLWHHELVYDNSGAELYVQCIPKLEEGVDIDDNNDIHIRQTYSALEIWNKPQIEIDIGGKRLYIERSQLKMLRNQTVKIQGSGISRINMSDIYDVSKKSSVYIHITITNE
jgi:hypothetical protein